MNRFSSVYIVPIAFLPAAFVLMAQTGVGSLAGVVVDSVGAVVPGAAVTIRHDATGREIRTVSSDAGVYAFPTLDVGSYTVTAEAKGFKKLVRPGIVIQTASRASLELRLEVGEVTQSVEVTAEAPLLAADTSDVGTNFQQKFMKDAPLFVSSGFRNPENFISFMPGVNNGQQDTSIDGGPRRSKEILIDGASHTNPESGGVAFIANGGIGSVEQYGEFKILNSNFSAEYGHTGGGVEIFVRPEDLEDAKSLLPE